MPDLLSLIATLNPHGTVQGINNVEAAYAKKYGPGQYKPIIPVTYWSFRLMAGFGLLAALLAAVGLWLTRRAPDPAQPLVLPSRASGRIEVGDTDLRSIPVQEWRRQVAWVPQDPHLFAASVAENIALGQPSADPDAIAAAARAAGAEEFIADLPQGYATQVGERGLRLSSGQRQQIALARAFLHDAPLLLLDEPTAHLDAVSAARLEDVLATQMADRTVIRVAHERGQATGSCPGWVYTMDEGRLRQAPVPAMLAVKP